MTSVVSFPPRLNGPMPDDDEPRPGDVGPTPGADLPTRRRINQQSAWIVASVAPFALVFGAAAASADVSLLEASGFSIFVFAGSAQFAAVEILGDGGSATSAVVAGLLLTSARWRSASSWLPRWPVRGGDGQRCRN